MHVPTNKAEWAHAGNKEHRDMLGRTRDIHVINKVINMHRKCKSWQEADKTGLFFFKKMNSVAGKGNEVLHFLFITDPHTTL